MTATADPAFSSAARRRRDGLSLARKRFLGQLYHHVVLLLGVALMTAPLLVALASSTYDPIVIHSEGLQLGYGGHFLDTYDEVLFARGGFTGDVTGVNMLWNSVILGLGFAIGKIVISMLAAYAIVYFRFPFASLAFWIILLAQ